MNESKKYFGLLISLHVLSLLVVAICYVVAHVGKLERCRQCKQLSHDFGVCSSTTYLADVLPSANLSIYKSKTTSSDRNFFFVCELDDLFIIYSFFLNHISAFPSTFSSMISQNAHTNGEMKTLPLPQVLYLPSRLSPSPSCCSCSFDFKDLYSITSHKSLLINRRKRKKMSRFRS